MAFDLSLTAFLMTHDPHLTVFLVTPDGVPGDTLPLLTAFLMNHDPNLTVFLVTPLLKSLTRAVDFILDVSRWRTRGRRGSPSPAANARPTRRYR